MCSQLRKLFFLTVLAVATNATSPAQTEISLDREVYLPSEAITITFRNAPGNSKDWIGLYLPEAGPQNYVDWSYLDGTQTGNVTLTDGSVVFAQGIKTNGTYFVRLLVNDGYAVAAESAEFRVDTVPRVRTDKAIFKPNEPMVVTFLNGPGNAKDRIALAKEGDPLGTQLDWLYVDGTQTGQASLTNGSVSFVGVASGGAYEVRFFENDTLTLLDAARFTVESGGPALTLAPGDGQVRLTWEAVVEPDPGAKYQILAATDPTKTFTPVGEVSGFEYIHTGLPNGVEICYIVRAVSNGVTGPDSSIQCTAPYALATNQFIAYQVPPGTPGNYTFSGALGLDFEVINPVQVDELGVFDDRANGLKSDLKVILYNRENMQGIATLTFTPQNPGVLKGGTRFKPLSTAVQLPLGFKGTIVAEGFSPDDKAALAEANNLGLRLESGGDSLYFSASRFGSAGSYPDNMNLAEPNLYGAGTFQFTATAPVAPGKPVLSAIPENEAVALSWQTVSVPLPAAMYEVFRGSTITGPFDRIAEVPSTSYNDTNVVNGTTLYYYVRAISAGGSRGVPSDILIATPDLPAAGIAYQAAAGSHGNQSFGGSAGNDFDVVRPVRITRLGVFDSESDGLKRTIKCRLYNRVTKQELALVEFTESSPGELIEGNRFKDLPAPINLPIGFKGTIVTSGYGTDEPVGNRSLGAVDQTLFTGGCLRFVGTSRWGENPDQFPEIIDGGPEDRYAAGTFYFEPASLSAKLTITRLTNRARIEWSSAGVLESAAELAGPWSVVQQATSGIEIPLEERARYYRLRQ